MILSNSKLSVLFIALVGVQVLSAISFAVFSDGYYAMLGGRPFKCSELFSSGGDDEVIMLIFVALMFPVAFRAVQIRRSVSLLEALMFFCILGASLWISIHGKDCGELTTTILKKSDIYLLTFTVSTLLSALVMICLVARR